MFETFLKLKRNAHVNPKLHHISEEETKMIQQVLLEMLADFDALCRKYNLSYCLTGGSALGAYRHNGFIPWDDDVDIMMLRKDYDQLSYYCDKDYKGKYWVQNLTSSSNYDLCFSKFRKIGTKYIEVFETDFEEPGFFLDVYPLEDGYDNTCLRFVNGIADELLFFIASCVRMYNKKELLNEIYGDTNLGGLIRLKCLLGRALSCRNDARFWFKVCEKWQKKNRNSDSKFVYISCGRGHYFGEQYPREIIFPLTEVEYCGKKVYVPHNLPCFLKTLYGPSYMVPPSSDEREYHSVIELDFGKEFFSNS